MIPARFQYVAPATLDEAIALLAQHQSDAKILAGGQSLIPLMKLRLASPALLIDINRVEGLSYIRQDNGTLRIGALTRESDVDTYALIKERYPILADTAAVVADPLVRNLATIGGNLAHGDPANDHPATMLAIGASVVARGPGGERVIPVAAFFRGVLTTALKDDEVLVEIRVPAPSPGSGAAYLKLERKVGDYATAGVAASIVVKDGVCEQAGLGLTNVGPVPIHATHAAEFLVGKRLDQDVVDEAARIAAGEARPSADLRGPVEYKRDMVRVLAVRALNRAIERTGR